MRCRKWQELEPWRPFFWASRIPTGIYLRAPHKPVLLPSGYEVDQEVYFAIRLVPMMETMALRIQRYAFLKNPGAHTQRSVKREGYWHFDGAIATSVHKSCKVLRNFMNFLEELAFYNIALSNHENCCFVNNKRFRNSTLSNLMAWNERLELVDGSFLKGEKKEAYKIPWSNGFVLEHEWYQGHNIIDVDSFFSTV